MDAPTEAPAAKKAKMDESAMEVEASSSSTGLSPLEALPKELMWKVFGLTSESALELRLASRSLRGQVDDFAVAQSTIPFVGKVSFSGKIEILPNTETKPTSLNIMVDIPKKKSGLFYLRLYLLNHRDFKEEMKKLEGKTAEETELCPSFDFFDVSLDVEEADAAAKLRTLSEWFGRRIDCVHFQFMNDKRVQDAVTSFLEDKQFSNLNLICDDLTEDVAVHLLKATMANKVTHLKLTGAMKTKIDTMMLLRQLATHLKGLHFYQTSISATNDNNSTLKHLFGTNNADWAEIIIELFSSPNTLNKICIENYWHVEYLTGSATDRLIDELPRLEKPIWFVATCNQYQMGFKGEAHKNYFVKINAVPAPPAGAAQGAGNRPAQKQFLQVKHVSRLNESTGSADLDKEIAEGK